jgi:hypothetical protein
MEWDLHTSRYTKPLTASLKKKHDWAGKCLFFISLLSVTLVSLKLLNYFNIISSFFFNFSAARFAELPFFFHYIAEMRISYTHVTETSLCGGVIERVGIAVSH